MECERGDENVPRDQGLQIDEGVRVLGFEEDMVSSV